MTDTNELRAKLAALDKAALAIAWSRAKRQFGQLVKDGTITDVQVCPEDKEDAFAAITALSPAPAVDDEVLDAVAEAIVGKIGHLFFDRTGAAVSRELAEVAINAYLAKQEPRT